MLEALTINQGQLEGPSLKSADVLNLEQLADQELTRLFPERNIQKVLFVAPPDGDQTMFDYATGKRGRYWNFPAYGIGVVASHLRQEGIEVDILNLNNHVLRTCRQSVTPESFDFDTVWKESLARKIDLFQPDLIGVTCMFTQTHTASVEVCEEVKYLRPDIPVTLGGVHITNSFNHKEQCKSILNDFAKVDLFFLYEAELAFKNFVQAVNRQKSLDSLFQVYFNTSQTKLHFAEKRVPKDSELDIVPAYDLMELEDLSNNGVIGSFACIKEKKARCATVLSNRGCRAQCTFCSVRSFNGRGVRIKSVQTVVDELLTLRNDFGVDHIMWLDDDLLFNHQRALELFNEMVRQNVGITWDCTNGVIAASCTEEMIAAAAESGCIGLNIGMESGNPEILKIVKKPGKVINFLKAAKTLKKYKQINARVFLMLGFPNETYEMIEDTFNVAMEMDLDWYNLTILQPLPNTPIFNSMVQQGLVEDVKAEDVRYNSGAYGKKRKLMEQNQFSQIVSPFANLENRDKIPSKEELEPIWLYMNYHLNFSRILNVEDPIKIRQQLGYLEYVANLVAPDDPLPMYFCGYLQKKVRGAVDPALFSRLESRLGASEYWQDCFKNFGLSLSELNIGSHLKSA